MTTRRVAGILGFLRDLDAVVQQVSGKPMSKHVEEWWREHGHPYLEELEKKRVGAHPLEADYALFGVTPDCSDQVVRYAYHMLMKRHHPDKGGRKQDAVKINGAYERICRARGLV